MSDHQNDIKSKIFTFRGIRAYLLGPKKGKKANKMEKVSSEDPFLQDAIEGYEKYRNNPDINRDLMDIRQFVEYRVSQEKKAQGPNLRIIGIAA